MRAALHAALLFWGLGPGGLALDHHASGASTARKHAQQLAAKTLARTGLPWTPGTFPDPKVNHDRCGRGGKASHICDPERLLSGGALDVEDGRLDALLNHSSTAPSVRGAAFPGCQSHGWQVYVAVAGELERGFLGRYASMEDGAKAFASSLGRSWGVLDTSCQNGFMVLYLVRDEYIVIVPDDGPAGVVVPEDLARHLANSAERHFHTTPDSVLGIVLAGLEGALAGTYTEQGLVNARAVVFLCLVAGISIMAASMLSGTLCYDAVGKRRHTARVAKCREKLQAAQILFECALDCEAPRTPFPSLGLPAVAGSAKAAAPEEAPMPHCPLCLEALSAAAGAEVEVYTCGHRAHGDCARLWRAARGHARGLTRCPVCVSSAAAGGARAAGSHASNGNWAGPRWGDGATRAFVFESLRGEYPDLISEADANRWVAGPPESWVAEFGDAHHPYRSIFLPRDCE